MTNSLEDRVETAAVGDLRPPPPETCVRRRFVQSTLFPISKKEQIDHKEEEEEEGGGENNEGEEEEDSDSNSKKRNRNSSKKKADNSNSNAKTTPRSRASKKVAVSGKEISSMNVDEGDSPVLIRSDFFLKNSEKGNQINHQDEQISVVLLEETNECCLSPNSPTNKGTPGKRKRQANSMVEEQKKTKTTPKKRAVIGGTKGPSPKKTLSEILLDGPTLQSIPNLRLEAKIMAEENSRLFAGKQIHPFFSSLKTSKRNQEIIDLENIYCSVDRKETSLAFNPIHVFDMVEDDAHSLDWGNWSVSERYPLSISSDLGISSSSVYEGHVNPLQFDDISSACCPAITLAYQSEISLDQCHVALNKDCPVDRIEASSSSISFNGKSQDYFFQHSYCNQPENCLWTDKFQPRKAAQICGNSESVKFLTEWLYTWHEKGSQASNSNFHGDSAVGQDNDYCWYQSDTDSENVDGETSLKNVLLVTGPVGSGKSAAIYACAKERGFQVIEVNASDWRSGALVKQRFGEALESHWLQLKVDNAANSESKPPSKSSPEIIEVAKGSENEVVEVISHSDEDLQLTSGIPSKSTCGENRVLNAHNATKTLILFEDVDVILSEDHGFLSTIKQLALTAKRPMILTANSYNPILPSKLEKLEVSFGMPSLKELLGLGLVVCEAEKANIHPCLIDRFVDSCQGDIRKTIMHLQFWCQGQSARKGNRSQITYSPLPFDLDAGHHILPKLIPWGFPSCLSEIVEEETTKSLTVMEERNSLMEIVAEEELIDGKVHKTSRIHGGETNFIDAKKAAILSLHCSIQNEDDLLAHPDCSYETSNSSESPVAFSRRNVRRKLEAVISSDSEEEYLGDSAPALPSRAVCDKNNKMQDVERISPPHCFSIGRCCHQIDQLSHIEEDKVEQTCIGCSENDTHQQIDGLCTLIDMSSVPESSFVPETVVDDKAEVFSAAVSSSFVLHEQEANSTSNNVLTNLILGKGEKCCTPLHENHEILGNGSDVDREILHREEVGDSHLEHVEDVIRGCPMLDECSRIDFARGVKNLEKPRSHQEINSIEETWIRLRKCSMDLQQYVTPEEKDALHALEVASAMSNLISDADLLLSSCQPQICDSLEPSLIPCESSELCSWYDDHLHMSSTVTQHGICFYTKKSVALGSKRGSLDRVDLAWGMLSSSTNKMALGKLLNVESKTMDNTEMRSQISCSSLRREMDSLCNILQSFVSPRAYFQMHGDAFHDYLASLSKISRFESNRLSEQASGRKRRRGRAARHYLSSGTNALSPEHISLLSQHSCHRKLVPNQENQILDKGFLGR